MILRIIFLMLLFSAFAFPSTYAQSESKSFKEFVQTHFENKYLINTKAKLKNGVYELRNTVDTSEVLRFHKFLRRMIYEEENQRQLAGKVNFGLNADRAGDLSLYKINTGFTLSRGTYPSEFQISSMVDVTLNNGVLTENLSNVFISYDKYFTDRIESFVFLNRLSDKFMSVDQRYEIGGGLVFEKKPRSDTLYKRKRRKKDKDKPSVLTKQDSIRNTKLYQKSTQKGKDILLELEMDTLMNSNYLWDMLNKKSGRKQDSIDVQYVANRIEREQLKNIRTVRNEYERFRFALLVGVGGEIEQNTLEENFLTPVDSLSIFSGNTFIRKDPAFRSETLSKSLRGDFIWRLILRPTATWRTDFFTLKWNSYFKLPLIDIRGIKINKRERVIEEDKPLEPSNTPKNVKQTGVDWRLENVFSLGVGTGPVSTTISYQWYYDNFPASGLLSPKEPSPIDKNVHLFQANKNHHVVRLTVGYKFD